MKNKILILVCVVLMFGLVSAAATNMSIQYGWNGTDYVPFKLTSDGKLRTDINKANFTSDLISVGTNLTVGSGVIQWNSSGSNFIYHDGSDWKQFATAGSTPVGGVVSFNLGSCPVGWNLADGTSGTVNLSNQFVNGEQVMKQYYGGNTSEGDDFNVTFSTAGWSVTRAIAVPYKDRDGNWRMRLTLNAVTTTATSTQTNIGIIGVVSKNVANFEQRVSVTYELGGSDGPEATRGKWNAGSNAFSVNSATNYDEIIAFTDIELDSKPDWADADASLIYCVKADTEDTTNGLFSLAGGLISLINTSHKLRIDSDVNITGQLNLGNGSIWYNDSDEKYYYYNKTQWVDIGSGSGSGETTKKSYTESGHGLSIGDAVYFNGTKHLKAISNDSARLGTGIVSSVAGDNFDVTYSGYISGLSGLVTGEYYFVSPVTEGLLSVTSGSNFSNPLLQATSTTTGVVYNWRAVELSSGNTAIWNNVSGVATYDDDVNISNNLYVGGSLTGAIVVDGDLNVTGDFHGNYTAQNNNYVYNGSTWVPALATATGVQHIYLNDSSRKYDAVPENGVMSFNQASCPAGWSLADGNSGTPNLTNQFVNGEQVMKTYYANSSENPGGDFNLTGTDWETLKAMAVPYKTKDGAWRLKITIRGNVASSSRASYSVTLPGVTFMTLAGFTQTLSASSNDGAYQTIDSYVTQGSNVIQFRHNTYTTTWYAAAGDVELDGKPTWADADASLIYCAKNAEDSPSSNSIWQIVNNVVGRVNESRDFAINTDNLYVNVTSGNVGIGTVSPSNRLEVVGDASNRHTKFRDTAGDSYVYIDSREATGGDSRLYFSHGGENGHYFSSRPDTAADNRSLFIKNTLTENVVMAFDKSDNVGIGTSSPNAPLKVQSVAENTVMIYRETSTAGGDVFSLKSNVGGTELEKFLIEADGDTTSSGCFYDVGGVVDGCSSSVEYKDNITDLNVMSLKEALFELRPVRFVWNNETPAEGIKDIGLIAEEVYGLVPDLVKFNKEGGVQGVKYDKVSLYNLEFLKQHELAIQELNQKEDSRYEELVARIEELEARE